MTSERTSAVHSASSPSKLKPSLMNVANHPSRPLRPSRLISRKPLPRTISLADLEDVAAEEDSEDVAGDVVATMTMAMVDTATAAMITAKAMAAMITARAMAVAMTTTLAILVMAIRVMEATEVVMIVATDMTTVMEGVGQA